MVKQQQKRTSSCPNAKRHHDQGQTKGQQQLQLRTYKGQPTAAKQKVFNGELNDERPPTPEQTIAERIPRKPTCIDKQQQKAHTHVAQKVYLAANPEVSVLALLKALQ
jgi:hypothetical protein